MNHIITFLLIVVMLSSCTPYKVNSSRAHLFEVVDCSDDKNSPKCLQQRTANRVKDGQNNAKNIAPFFGSNPVFIAEDTKFSIEIDQIKPPNLSYSDFTKKVKKGIDHARDRAFRRYGPLSSDSIEKNIRDKELWLLTTIKSQNVNDPLEANSKTYVKSTQVKWDSGSHLLVPLDKSEQVVFTHESDASYRVRFQLMEVDALAVKKELAILRNQSGALNFLQVGLTTLLDILNTAVGKEYINSKIDPIISNDAAFQRFLLSIGATVEFIGEVVVLRKNLEFADKYQDELFQKDDYYLIDGFRNNTDNHYSHSTRSNAKFTWNHTGKNENALCVKKNSGGIILDACKENSSSTGVSIDENSILFTENSAGFIKFSVSQIPVKLTQSPASLEASHINQYYDYSRLSKFLTDVNNDIFTLTEACYLYNPTSNSKSICKEGYKAQLGLDQRTDENSGEALLNAAMLNQDLSQFNNSKNKYEELGKDLICLEIADHKNQVSTSKQKSELDAFLTTIDAKIEQQEGLEKLHCKERHDRLNPSNKSHNFLSQTIKKIRKRKNELAILNAKKKSEITSRVYQYIKEQCSPKKSGDVEFTVNERKYNCPIFIAIDHRHNSFMEMSRLLNRPND